MIGILITYVIVSSQDEPTRGLRAILSLLCLEVVALSALAVSAPCPRMGPTRRRAL